MRSLFAIRFVMGVVLTIAATATHAAERPNVILILADDMAPGDFASANGGLSRTPHLDHLAKQSVVFDQAYSASCVCAPARAALLAGRYPHRTGVVTLNMNRYPDLTRLRYDETTIAEVLGASGYATGLVGKWHCGAGSGYSPLRHGFDEFEGFSGSQDLSYYNYTLQVDQKKRDVVGDYLTDDLSRRAIEFVNRHRDEPFFLHLAHYAPHRPLEAPEELVAFYRNQGCNESTATIYAMIEVMDRGIGQLMAELQRLNLADRTVVVFASDNGPDPVTGTRFNQDLKGTKYEVHEGGIRVPLMVRWPSRFRPANVQEMVHFVDVFPTLLELCGIRYTAAPPIDGASFRRLLEGDSRKQTPRFWQWNRGKPNYTHNAAMREGDWKLVRPYVTRAVNPDDSTRPPALFDVAEDPAEVNDLSKDHPERTAQMNKTLSTWSQSVEGDRVREATNPAPTTPDGTLLRVLSYNIHHAEGVDRKLDVKRIAGVIRSVRPDLVSLQEVDQDAKRSKSIDQPAELARLTKMNVVFGANIELQGGHYGNAVLSRFPVIRQQNHRLPNIDDGEQRGVIEAEIQIPGQKETVVFLATHLDHRTDERERQASAKAINQLIAKYPQRSVLLAGDLNAVVESKTLDRLTSMWTSVNERPLPTIPVKRPTKQIDFILYRPQTQWSVVEVNVLDEAVASDHRAIFAVLKRLPVGSSF